MQAKDISAERLGDLRRIDGVAALPPQFADGGALRTAGQTKKLAPEVLPVLPTEDLARFRAAGWDFVTTGSAPAASNARPVFQDGDGHMKIDSGSLNVRFAEAASSEEIEAILRSHKLAIKRRLGFAPNLFSVGSQASGTGADSLDMARTLSTLDNVEYAEPVLIEPIGSRKSGR